MHEHGQRQVVGHAALWAILDEQLIRVLCPLRWSVQIGQHTSWRGRGRSLCSPLLGAAGETMLLFADASFQRQCKAGLAAVKVSRTSMYTCIVAPCSCQRRTSLVDCCSMLSATCAAALALLKKTRQLMPRHTLLLAKQKADQTMSQRCTSLPVLSRWSTCPSFHGTSSCSRLDKCVMTSRVCPDLCRARLVASQSFWTTRQKSDHLTTRLATSCWEPHAGLCQALSPRQ